MKIELNGYSLALETVGAGQERTLVYLPSIMGEARDIAFVEALARQMPDATIHVLQYPGCRESTGSAMVWHSMTDAVFDLARVMDHISSRPVTLVGASLGGWLAAEFAAWYPKQLEALVLAAPFGLRVHDLAIESPFREKGSSDFGSLFYERANPNEIDLAAFLTPSLLPAEAEDRFGVFLHLHRVQGVAARLGFNPLMHDRRLVDRLSNIACPSLVIWGAKDAVLPPAYGTAFAGAIPNAILDIDVDAGHFPLIEGANRHADRVADFLASAKCKVQAAA